MLNREPSKRNKRVRRSVRKKPTLLSIYYCNINGFQSKKESIRKAVDKLNPQIIVLCETKLATANAVKKLFPEYEICTRPTKAGKSGLAICIQKEFFQSILDVTTSCLDDILTVRISKGGDAIRVILGYAPQENETVDVREAFFTELEIEISKCKMAEEQPLVFGDMNSKINLTDGSITHESPNGKLLLEMIKNQDLDVLNYHSECRGKWTHVIRTTGASSVLDYILSPQELTKSVDEILIDEECLFCPFRVKKVKGAAEAQFSDHNAIISKFHITNQKVKKIKPVPKWKLTEEGMEKFHQITSHGFDSSLPRGNPQEKYNAMEDHLNSTMSKCFKKNKPRGSKVPVIKGKYLSRCKQLNDFAKKGKIQRKVAKVYIQEMIKMNTEDVAATVNDKVVSTMKKLTIDNKFSPENFWKLCRHSRKQITNNMSVETTDGRELFGDNLIRNAYRDEFLYRLRKREIVNELHNYETRTEQICKLRIGESRKTREQNYTMDELKAVQKSLKAGKSSGRDLLPPEVFIRCGTQLDTLLLSVLNVMKSAELAPEQWLQVQITTIYKNKGKKKLLVNYRGIFLKQILSKIFEKLNMNRIRPEMAGVDKFQAGNQTERCPADQTFLLRAAIDHSIYMKKPLYVTLYDFSQCFDSLWLSDCLLCLWKLGVRSETLHNIKKLNQSCNFIVKTPFGTSEEASVESIVQQGSVSGGALCSASTAEVTQEDLGNGCQIGLLTIRALTFVDDIAGTNTKPTDTNKSHNNVVWFSKKKRLGLNIPKCMCMCINRRCTDVLPHLEIDGKAVSYVELCAYLGDQFNTRGTNQDLVNDRVKKGKMCIITAVSLCDDVTMGTFAIQTLLLLYQSLFLQVILFNSRAWSKLTETNIKALQRIQLKYLKRIFHTPASTPKSITFLETGSIPIEQEIHMRQLNYLHHVVTREDNHPLKMAYTEQSKYKFEENWGNEIQQTRQKYDLHFSDDEITKMSKKKWNNIVLKSINRYALEFLNNELKSLKHPTVTAYRHLKQQDYLRFLQPQQARHIFQIRSGMIDLKAVRKYWYSDPVCRLCHHGDEDVEHVVNVCPNVSRSSHIENLYTDDIEVTKQIAGRFCEFKSKVDDAKST